MRQAVLHLAFEGDIELVGVADCLPVLGIDGSA